MLQITYGVSNFIKKSKNGRDVMEDLPRHGRQGRPLNSATKVNIAKVKERVTKNSYSTFIN
jgi:hypothetical protein